MRTRRTARRAYSPDTHPEEVRKELDHQKKPKKSVVSPRLVLLTHHVSYCMAGRPAGDVIWTFRALQGWHRIFSSHVAASRRRGAARSESSIVRVIARWSAVRVSGQRKMSPREGRVFNRLYYMNPIKIVATLQRGHSPHCP